MPKNSQAFFCIIAFVLGGLTVYFFQSHPLKEIFKASFLHYQVSSSEKKNQPKPQTECELSEEAAKKHLDMFFVPKKGISEKSFTVKSEDRFYSKIEVKKIVPDQEDKYNFYFSKDKFSPWTKNEIFNMGNWLVLRCP